MATDHSSLIDQLRQIMEDVEPLPEDENFHISSETLTRFLKARDWNIDGAEKQLKDTVEWRRRTRPDQIECRWCHEKPGYHCIRQIGFDEMGRPVLYSNFAQASARKLTVEDSVAHVTYIMENAKRTMRPGVCSVVLIIDCTGMTLPSCNPRLGYGVSQILSNYYPERLGLVICLNHSRLFQGVWKAIKAFMQPATTAKVQLIRSKKKLKEMFSNYLSEETVSWLSDEIKMNKQKPLPESQREFWKGGDGSEHDPRGCLEYVESYIEGNIKVHSKHLAEHVGHKPHPNIVDFLVGSLQNVHSSNGEHVAAGVTPHDDNDEDWSDTGEHIDDLEIDEEFQIPKDSQRI